MKKEDFAFHSLLPEITRQVAARLEQCPAIGYAFLFGSATQHLLPGSDVDILIGPDLDFEARAELSLDLEEIVRRQVDLVSAQAAPSWLALRAMAHGTPLLVRNRDLLKQDYFRCFYAYEDAWELLQLRRQRLQRRFGYGG